MSLYDTFSFMTVVPFLWAYHFNITHVLHLLFKMTRTMLDTLALVIVFGVSTVITE